MNSFFIGVALLLYDNFKGPLTRVLQTDMLMYARDSSTTNKQTQTHKHTNAYIHKQTCVYVCVYVDIDVHTDTGTLVTIHRKKIEVECNSIEQYSLYSPR